MPRFVILEHDYPFLHWDLMLEAGETLRTWRLLAAPHAGVQAEELPDHRIAYLSYEGPVSGNRGTVRRWDSGEYILESETGSVLRLRFVGEEVQGIWNLRRSQDGWVFEPFTASPGTPCGPGCS